MNEVYRCPLPRVANSVLSSFGGKHTILVVLLTKIIVFDRRVVFCLYACTKSTLMENVATITRVRKTTKFSLRFTRFCIDIYYGFLEIIFELKCLFWSSSWLRRRRQFFCSLILHFDSRIKTDRKVIDLKLLTTSAFSIFSLLFAAFKCFARRASGRNTIEIWYLGFETFWRQIGSYWFTWPSMT